MRFRFKAGMFAVGLLIVLSAAFQSFGVRAAESGSSLGFRMKDIDGETVGLERYKGRVVLMVNTASKCGNTPQYEALQSIYEKYKDRGLTVLAFPANNFGRQEPGTDSEIKQFCQTNYGVSFPIFAKVSVKGDDICPLYGYLTSESTNPGFSGEISWNFEKFLLDRDGRVVARFAPKTKPDSREIISALEKELASR
ncbi:glutathione peroxidase [candidate division KSB1 bacterium]